LQGRVCADSTRPERQSPNAASTPFRGVLARRADDVGSPWYLEAHPGSRGLSNPRGYRSGVRAVCRGLGVGLPRESLRDSLAIDGCRWRGVGRRAFPRAWRGAPAGRCSILSERGANVPTVGVPGGAARAAREAGTPSTFQRVPGKELRSSAPCPGRSWGCSPASVGMPLAIGWMPQVRQSARAVRRADRGRSVPYTGAGSPERARAESPSRCPLRHALRACRT
jgi:hypothetical protein